MPTLTVTTVEADRVTLVEAVLEADRTHRVRLEPRFDGPIWPPRTEGTTGGDWDGDGMTTTVGSGRTAIGFATPVRPGGKPLEIVESEAIEDRLPRGIRTWIGRVEERLTAAERLGEIDDLATATDAVQSVGGLTAVETLAAEIARDRRLASRLSIVPENVSTRLEAVDIPVRTLAKIASGAGERN